MSVSLYVAFWHLIEPFYYYLLSFLSFQFLAHRTDHRSHWQAVTCRLTRKPVHQIHLESDHHTRSSDPTLDQATRPETIVRPDHQIRPSDQDARLPDHRPQTTDHRPQTIDHHPCLLSFQSAQLTQPLEMLQVRCILYGLGQGWYIELWMNLAKHTFHTRSAYSLRIFFGLT